MEWFSDVSALCISEKFQEPQRWFYVYRAVGVLMGS